MRVLFLLPGLNKHQNFKPLINIANFLTDKGHEVFIAHDNKIDENISNDFSELVVFLEKKSNLSKLNWMHKLLCNDFDCFIGVKAHNAFWLVLGKICFLKFTKKIISWEHSSPLSSLKNEYKNSWPLWLFIRYSLAKFTDAFFCVSNGAVNEMNKILSRNSKKAMYTPNFIFKNDDIVELARKINHDKKINFISVGRLSKEKGLFLALEALSKLEGLDYQYLIVGDGPCYTGLYEYANSHPNLLGNVQFLGRRNEVLSLMLNSDVILLPSYFEGLPTVLVEACIAKIPIIASDCNTGPSEIVEEGVNGYLFKVGDVEDLYNKINLWILNRDKIENSSYYVKDYSEISGDCFLRNISKVVNLK